MQILNRRDFIKLILSVPVLGGWFSGCTFGKESNHLTWTSIDVCSDTMQGDAHLVSKNGKHYLIDGGYYDLARTHLIPYLKERKVTRLDAAMINHPHADHYGGIKALLEDSFSIGRLYMNMPTPQQMEQEWWGGKYQDLVEIRKLAAKNGIPIFPIRQGDKFIFDDSSHMEVLYICDGIHTPIGHTDINDMSAITMIVDGKNRFLLAGDLNLYLGTYLAENAHNISADVFKVPHHGTEKLVPNSFFEKVSPRDIIITAPKYLWCDKRSERIRSLAVKQHYGTYINGYHGHIAVISNGNNYTIATEKTPKKICS